MADYLLHIDDVTGAESRTPLPYKPPTCHRCGTPSRQWYCDPCARHLMWSAALPLGALGILAGLLLIVYAVGIVLGVTS